MALPTNFSSWEHLQSVLKSYHNKLVRDEFIDIASDDLINDPRGSLKTACLLTDDDTVNMTLLRLHLFFFHARKARDIQAPIYGVPINAYDEDSTYHPHINFFFREDEDQVVSGKNPVRSEICVRVMNETSASMTETKAIALGNKIKAEFGQNDGYRWRKGKYIISYKRPDQGYRLKVFAYSEAEARQVISKVLNIQNHTLEDTFLTIHESKASFPANPGTQIVYGKTRPKPVRRPTTYVRFRHANLTMYGLNKGVMLFDLSLFREGLVKP